MVQSTNKKILTTRTSVYDEYYTLKKNALTENGYFDLVQILNLRIYAGSFLNSERIKLGLTIKDYSRLLNVSYLALQKWENDKTATPLDIITKIKNKEIIYNLIEKGIIKISKNIRLPLKYNEISSFLPFLSIRGDGEVIIKRTGKKYVSRISKQFNRKIYFSPNKQFVLKSVVLHNFIKTFFQKKKETKLKPPLTDFIKDLKKGSIDLKKSVIIPLIQTDGCHIFDKRKKRFYIVFKNTNKLLHNILVDSFYLSYKELPSSYLILEKKLDNHTQAYVTRYGNKNFQKVHSELIGLCGNFKTSRYYAQSIEDYKKETTPNLTYLINAKRKEKEIALRIWASTEGAIIPMRIRKNNLIVPKLQISCANKEILFQLKKVTDSLNIHFTIKKETGLRYKGLNNMAISCALAFLKTGGFIEGVKISKSSKYYEGIDKQDVLYATLEYMVKERENHLLRSIKMKEVHKKIRKIAENKDFKKLKYYINHFSKNDKVKKCLS